MAGVPWAIEAHVYDHGILVRALAPFSLTVTHLAKIGVTQFDQAPQLVVGIAGLDGLLNVMVEKRCRTVTQTEFATQHQCGSPLSPATRKVAKKAHLQGDFGAMEECLGREGRLMATASALVQRGSPVGPLTRPVTRTLALGTNKSLRPPLLE